MSEELPFQLRKHHKTKTKSNWKKRGLIETNEKIEEIYQRIIRASHCELCGKAFKSPNDRCMNYCHETGKFRNIVCREQCIYSIMEELPFKLAKCHKPKTKFKWKSRGLIETDEKIEEIYQKCIRTSHCELCGKAFKNSRDRQMDHDHITGKFRNIVCAKCNQCKRDKKFNSNTGEKWIYKIKCKTYKQGFCYITQIFRNSKRLLCKTTLTLEEAIEVRDKFLEENPEIFT
jgi:hypothetical protein